MRNNAGIEGSKNKESKTQERGPQVSLSSLFLETLSPLSLRVAKKKVLTSKIGNLYNNLTNYEYLVFCKGY